MKRLGAIIKLWSEGLQPCTVRSPDGASAPSALPMGNAGNTGCVPKDRCRYLSRAPRLFPRRWGWQIATPAMEQEIAEGSGSFWRQEPEMRAASTRRGPGDAAGRGAPAGARPGSAPAPALRAVGSGDLESEAEGSGAEGSRAEAAGLRQRAQGCPQRQRPGRARRVRRGESGTQRHPAAPGQGTAPCDTGHAAWTGPPP